MSRFLAHWALIALFSLSGCGFKPMYGAVDDYDIEVGTYLASTEIQAGTASDMLGQQLRNALEDRFNPDSSISLYDKAFRLEVSLRQQRQAAVMQQTGNIGRFNVLLISNYRLVDTETREVLDSGEIRRTASYFNSPERFASYIAEKDAVQRALLEMSEDYRMRLAAFFAREYKLGQRNP